MLVVGIDCATDDGKVGVALADRDSTRFRVIDIRLATKDSRAASMVSDWLEATTEPALLAVDAPLGWPAAMGKVLSIHEAGFLITLEGNSLFRRETDREIQRRLRKTPLDVGADRIARTAHSALRMLHEIRENLEDPIPLAWAPEISRTSVIEVYPAATIVARGLSEKDYKKAEHTGARTGLVNAFKKELQFECPVEVPTKYPDALDAVACLLAAKDFLEGRAVLPSDFRLAQKEGWIWAP